MSGTYKNVYYKTEKNWNKKNYSPNPIKVPKDGVDRKYISNIDDSFFLDLKCSICHNLLWNPMECNECGNSFCEYCIKQNLSNGNLCCPLCKSKQFNPRKAKGLKKFLNKIRIRCNNKQCREMPEYFDYVNHLEKCPFRIYHCTNEGCKYEDTLDNIKYHSSECQYRIIKCKFCEKEIRQYTFEIHEKTECTQNIECVKCHTSMTRGFFWKNHYSEKDENISCLKARNNWKDNELKKANVIFEEINMAHQKEIENYKNYISQLMEEKKIINKENDKLKKELKEWNHSFKNIYEKLVLKKKPIDEDIKEKKYNTIETDNINDNNRYKDKNNYYNRLQMTPQNLQHKKINYNNK